MMIKLILFTVLFAKILFLVGCTDIDNQNIQSDFQLEDEVLEDFMVYKEPFDKEVHLNEKVKTERKIFAKNLLNELKNNDKNFEKVYETYKDMDVYYQTFENSDLSKLSEDIELTEESLDSIDDFTIHDSLVEWDNNNWHIIKFLEQEEWEYNFETLKVDHWPSWVPIRVSDSWESFNSSYIERASIDRSAAGEKVVLLDFNNEWEEIFCNITEENLGNEIAVFLGWEKIQSVTIREPICGGRAQIVPESYGESIEILVEKINHLVSR